MSKYIIDYIIYLVIRILSFIVILIPRGIIYKVGEILGSIVFYLFPKYRKVVVNNFTYIYGEKWNKKKILTVAKEAFKQQGKNLIEFLTLFHLSEKDIRNMMELQDTHYLDEALKKQKGVILVSIHLANFQLALARVAMDYPLYVVGRPLPNKFIHNFVNKFYKQKGINLIFHGEEDFKEKYLNILRENKILVIAADIPAREKSIIIDFLGKPTLRVCGYIAVAKKMHSPIIAAFPVREKDNTHKVFFEKEVELQFNNDENDIINNTVTVNRIIEKYINQYPEQWFWWHKRWRKVKMQNENRKGARGKG